MELRDDSRVGVHRPRVVAHDDECVQCSRFLGPSRRPKESGMAGLRLDYEFAMDVYTIDVVNESCTRTSECMAAIARQNLGEEGWKKIKC